VSDGGDARIVFAQSLTPDPINFALNGIPFMGCQGQGKEQTDPSIQN